MQRKLLVTVHLYLAAFFAPLIILVGLTGGLYLLGFKGSVERIHVATLDQQLLAEVPEQTKEYITDLLNQVEIEHSYDYVRAGVEPVTRPTSRTYYTLKQVGPDIVVTQHEPNLMSTLMELHKGHGPIYFRYFQILCALGLLVVMISGLYLGLQSPMLRNKTLVLSGSGLLVFAITLML